MDLACDGTETILETFVRCLAVLPNLHTLEVTSVESDYLFYNTMNGTKLPQIRTLILPSMAHHLLRHCPNVEDFTCTNFRPDEELAKSLAKGQRKLKTLAVLFSGDSITWKSEECSPCSEYTVNILPFRLKPSISSRPRMAPRACELVP